MVITTTCTTVSYEVAAIDASGTDGMSPEMANMLNNEEVISSTPNSRVTANTPKTKQHSSIVVENPETQETTAVLLSPNDPVPGFGFFSSPLSPTEDGTSRSPPVIEMEILKKPSTIKRILSWMSTLSDGKLPAKNKTSLSPDEISILADKFLHHRSGNADAVSIDPSFITRRSSVSSDHPPFTESLHSLLMHSHTHFQGHYLNPRAASPLSRAIDNEESTTDDKTADGLTTEEPTADEPAPTWQQILADCYERRNAYFLMQRELEVLAIEETARENFRKSKQWLAKIQVPDEVKKESAYKRIAKKAMKGFGKSKVEE